MSTVSSVRNTAYGLLLVLLSAGFSAPSLAQTGSSIPYFEVDTLTIPRIDVEGYGSLRLSLLLVDEVALTFIVSAAVDADVGVTPGATYDLQTAVLDIPLVNADFEFYSLQLQLIPGDLFQVIVADDAIVTGQDEYNQQHQLRLCNYVIFLFNQSIITRLTSSGFSCWVQWPLPITVYFSRSLMKSSNPSAEEGGRMTSFSAPM